MTNSLSSTDPRMLTACNLQQTDFQGTDVQINRSNNPFPYKKLAETIFLRPTAAISQLVYRSLKNLTYVPLKAVAIAVYSGRAETENFLAEECLATIKATKNVFSIPLKIKRAINDIRSPIIEVNDTNPSLKPIDYLKTDYNVSFQHFSSENFSNKNFRIISLDSNIHEMPAYTDSSLKAVMGSHFLKGGMMGINFGCPNVALFTTHESDQDTGSITTVNAKSLKRADMVYKDSNGKLQSGIFLIPTNLPKGAIEALEEAARKLEGRRDYTCVNTNCRILKLAGFTMDGLDLEDSYLPTTFLEDVLFRNMYYKGEKIHFDIVKTTPLTLEEYFEKIDSAILTTPTRHWNRNKDTEIDKQERSEKAKLIIAEEKELLKNNPVNPQPDNGFEAREIKVGISSALGNIAARIWGRHTVYEINLSDKKDEIVELFNNRLLKPFPQEKASLVTRIKRDVFFSKRAINFLRSHMIGRQEAAKMGSRDFLRLLKSTGGVRLNYTLLPDRVIIARVNGVANKNNEIIKKAADWALSKHALIANRENVMSAGEIWYDKESDKFFLNNNSGTYLPDVPSVEKTVELAKQIFQTDSFVVSDESK